MYFMPVILHGVTTCIFHSGLISISLSDPYIFSKFQVNTVNVFHLVNTFSIFPLVWLFIADLSYYSNSLFSHIVRSIQFEP